MNLPALSLRAVGLSAPGLPNWAESQSILRGELPWAEQDYVFQAPPQLPPNERRRSTRITRLAFAACADALTQAADLDPGRLSSIFASCSGDLDVIDAICRSLAQAPGAISPLQFHNSVHNASGGYWSIATQARGPSVSLSAFEGSLAAGLLEAALQLAEAPSTPVLLCAYDIAPPEPLRGARPVHQPFACSVLLEAGPVEGRASIHLCSGVGGAESQMADPGLEALRLTNPAARSLPLLQAVAQGGGTLSLPSNQGPLRVELRCP